MLLVFSRSCFLPGKFASYLHSPSPSSLPRRGEGKNKDKDSGSPIKDVEDDGREKAPSPRPSPSLGRGREEGVRLILGRNRYGHFDAFEWIIAAVSFGGDDTISDFHAADDFSEGRILTIQERRIGDADKKL